MRRALVITVSDRSASGARPDSAGPAVAAILEGAGFEAAVPIVVADDRAEITAALRGAVDAGFHLVATTGGTGLGPRDVTPEATGDVIERTVPGIAELMRAAGAASTPRAALSRAVAGTVGQTLIVNLPGSPGGATESLTSVLEVLGHAIDVLAGSGDH